MTMDYKKKIEIPFGAFDSELIRQEISIPNGFKDVIDGNKIILTRAESTDEKIRKEILEYFVGKGSLMLPTKVVLDKWIAWLEKQGEPKEYTFKSLPRLLDMIEPSDRAKAYCQKLIDTLAKEEYNTDAKIVEEVLKGWNGEDVPMAVMDEQKPVDKAEPKFKVKYAGSEYNVLEIKDIAGVAFYGIEDEPNHIDYVKAENCEIIDGYAIKENGSPYPTKPAVFPEKKPKRMVSAEAKEAIYDKPACVWSEEDEKMCQETIDWFEKKCFPYALENDNPARESIKWLKSLKNRAIPQPKQGWSEEDAGTNR